MCTLLTALQCTILTSTDIYTDFQYTYCNRQILFKIAECTNTQEKKKQSERETEASGVYYNTGSIARRRKTEHDIPISELEAYVKKRLATKDNIIKEFQVHM